MEVSDHAQFHARCHFNDIRRLTMLNLAAGMTSVTGTGSVRTYEANIKDAWCLLVTPLGRPKKNPARKCLLAITSCHFRRRLSSGKVDILLWDTQFQFHLHADSSVFRDRCLLGKVVLSVNPHTNRCWSNP